jgi:hypothetical protein
MAVKAEHACTHGKQYAKAGNMLRLVGELDKREEVQNTINDSHTKG